MASEILSWAHEHPTMAVVGAVIIGGGLLYALSGSGNGGGGDNSAAAFFAAQTAQAQSGNALQAVQIQAQAQTAQTLIAGDVSKSNNSVWAATDLAETQSNNATSLGLAPYQTESDLIAALGGSASKSGAVLTDYKSKGGGGFGLGINTGSSGGGAGGFLGIGGKTKVTETQTYVADPSATAATQGLLQLVSTFASPGNTALYAAH